MTELAVTFAVNYSTKKGEGIIGSRLSEAEEEEERAVSVSVLGCQEEA
jgi:hypothetical protein